MNLIDKIKVYISDKKSLPIFVGMLCLGLIFVFFSDFLKNETTDNAVNTPYTELNYESSENLDKVNVEELEHILSKVYGLGEVEILVTYKSTAEDVILKDINEKGEEISIMQSEGGKTEPYIRKKLYPGIEGVIIVAEGGDNEQIKSEVLEAISAITEVPIHKIKILKMK